ncbi:hypothetical protein [Botryobacter ruber]|uniref:hypothetical protein n=1 Tax=Botryobacter ruber TaxID=2171629 RepID=UPI000E0AFC05|nr:hypothetical protein [Botryobacter ruber]
MKTYLFFLFIIFTGTTYGQSKYSYIHFNSLIEVKGTEFVIASIDNNSKLANNETTYLLFLDTNTGNSVQVDIPKGGYVRKIEQVKIDSLGINKIIITAKTVDLDQKNGIDWTDPEQILVLSPDGKDKKQITDANFFTRVWTVNRQTGTLVITGHYDTNENGKYDKKDQNMILLIDLKTLELKSQL